MTKISCEATLVTVDGLTISDAGLAELLRRQPEDRWEEVVERALTVGARGLLTMGLGIDISEVDARVRRSVEEVTAEARRQVEAILNSAAVAFAQSFDPEHRTSLIGKMINDFTGWRDGFLQGLDPSYADSHTARFLAELDDLLGPQGLLETRLRQVLDPDSDGSALAHLSRSVDARFVELRDLIVGEQARTLEAERGTAKGVRFEDRVDEVLRMIGKALGGCVVEHTGRLGGALGSNATVGDFVVVLPAGHRVLVEVKDVARLPLGGKDGILAELDRGMANRSADFAVCVSAQDAFPKEVGSFGAYGNRVLVVDDGEGTMIALALRWAAATVTLGGVNEADGLDTGLVFDRLGRLRTLAQGLATDRRSLTEVRTLVEKVRDSLGGTREELTALAEELDAEINRACRSASEKPTAALAG